MFKHNYVGVVMERAEKFQELTRQEKKKLLMLLPELCFCLLLNGYVGCGGQYMHLWFCGVK